MSTYTREQIDKARQKADAAFDEASYLHDNGAGPHPGSVWIDTFTREAGLDVESAKPAPGVYLHDDGTVIEVYGEGPTPVQSFHESSDWPAENRDKLTPAVVAPKGAPVRLTEAEVGEMWDAVVFDDDKTCGPWEAVGAEYRVGYTRLANAALARHSHGRALPEREEVERIIHGSININAGPEERERVTDAVMALLEGGKA